MTSREGKLFDDERSARATSAPMTTRSLALVFVLFAAARCLSATPPPLPCKSPEELLKAVEFALTNQDTNYFWQLCYWKDVPKTNELTQRRIRLIHFKNRDETKNYSDFRLLPAPADVNKPRFNRQPNLPILGFIGYKTKGTTQIGDKTSRYSAGGDIEYGKAPDGTYWLTVNVPVSAAPQSRDP
jgi:hypothetical protein